MKKSLAELFGEKLPSDLPLGHNSNDKAVAVVKSVLKPIIGDMDKFLDAVEFSHKNGVSIPDFYIIRDRIAISVGMRKYKQKASLSKKETEVTK